MINNRGHRVKVYAAMPVLNEAENIPSVLRSLLDQEGVDTEVIVCVNQPDEWHEIPLKSGIIENNQLTIDYLKSLNDSRITVIDKSSKGNGWIGRKHGVGWARKVAMDVANDKANPEDIIISADADTYYTPDYFNAVVNALEQFPDAAGLSVPYYHQLTGNEIADRCILRYEIYMRNYALNMLLIRNPYCFSAIGSGMACTAATYRKVCGLTPKMSGEDFYFVQKLRKSGNIIIDCEEVIYPASRFSDRVYFGTGPAMIKGRTGNWDSYPIYHQDLFLDIKTTFDLFPEIYRRDIPTPMDDFLSDTFQEPVDRIWAPLRTNSRDADQFSKAASQKIDGLRILQFLKESDQKFNESSESRLYGFINSNLQPGDEINSALDDLLLKGFENVDVTTLNLLRDFMFVNERRLQKIHKLA